jgi:Flp pilus assembly protein TadD
MRITDAMYRTANGNRLMGLALTTAMAGALLSGCTSAAAPRADLSAGRAEAALASGQHEAAIGHAEAAVLAEPHNAAYRAMLGSAYLDAGRFASAATSFDDAMELGDNTPRTALSLALALMGQGKQREAASLLGDFEDQIATSDLGLALALSGQPDRAVELLGNAIRSGQNDAKTRQNLAYAYALAGRWVEARVMAAQDVPGNLLDARIEQWALMAQPDAAQQRIAHLLQVPAGTPDAGQPAQLALSNNPSIEQLASEASAFATAQPDPELPPIVSAPPAPLVLNPPVKASVPAAQPVDPNVGLSRYEAAPTARPNSFETAFAAPAPSGASLAAVTQDALRFVQAPVTQTAPMRQGSTPEPRAAQAGQRAEGTHRVQLGSFTSEQGARRAWGIYVKKYPELAGHQMVISEAVVRGKRYFRVAAAGFGKASSGSMCGKVKSGGEGCLAYAAGKPLPGTVDTGVRLARR